MVDADGPDARTLTDRALEASADRILHAATAMDRDRLAEPGLTVVYQGERGFFTNVAYVTSPTDDWPGLVARIRTVVPIGRPLSLLTAVTTPDLTELGWELVGHPPLMVRPAGGTPSTPPVELSISDVGDDAGLEAFEHTLVDGFPDPALQPYTYGSVYDARVLGGPTRFFTGSVAGRPVAVAVGHVSAGVNLVEMVATMPEARGRGYGEALTWRATTVDPAAPAVLLASDPGRPVYERMGFLAASRWTFWYQPG